jgi:Pectinacetylesterase
MRNKKMQFNKSVWILVVLLWILLVCSGCSTDENESSVSDEANDDAPGNDDINDDSTDEDDDVAAELQREKLEAMFEKMEFLPYLDFQPVRTEEIYNGYTRYFYSIDDFKCFDGTEANVAVSFGDSNNLTIFMDGGGAAWPGYNFGFEIDVPRNEGYISRWAANPLRDWNIVYIPYCDNGLHAGDNEIQGSRGTHYYHGSRHTAAAVALAKELFPHPDKVLVTGISAGGFGTYFAWPIVKSVYMDTDTFILNDSGVGFWNPERPETFELIKEAWNLRIPDDCQRCQEGTVQTWLLEVFMEYDPQLRIGMFTSYRDFVISSLFLGMNGGAFEALTMDVTGQIKQEYPERFSRYFIKGRAHTSSLLIQGPNYSVDGLSLYEWIGRLVNDDPRWDDVLE